MRLTIHLRRRLFVLPLIAACLSAAPAEKPPSDARRMLELSGTAALGEQLTQQIVRQIKPELPNVPLKFWDDFIASVDSASLLDELAPVYEKHFTPDELQELLKFYQSPVGQKLVSVQPKLNHDTLGAGQKWGTRVTQDLMKKLKQQGYLR